MTDPRYAPTGLAAGGDLVDADDVDTRPVVGADDARDDDGVPVGAADADADRARAAGEQG
ncbi:hypothetical protein [Micromonospora wenchangensis]|uniref:hypothetical protein n=1 Tax=Micromonospora wenchangensis TaxID=1185415 RepID=UPI003D742354